MHARRCSSEIDVCTGLKMRASAAILLASSFLDFFFFSDERMEEISAAACITCAWCAEATTEGRKQRQRDVGKPHAPVVTSVRSSSLKSVRTRFVPQRRCTHAQTNSARAESNYFPWFAGSLLSSPSSYPIRLRLERLKHHCRT